MKAMPEACQPSQLEAFLSNALSDVELNIFEEHLSSCSTCRSALDGAVAERQDWDAMRHSLLGETQPDSFEAASETDPSPEQSAIRYYQSLLAPSDHPNMIGRIGNYEVVGLLGSGGMGVVFKAFDASLNRYVAIKMLAPHIASNPLARKRFFREAQATAAIAHEHVIAIHAVSQWQDRPYLVMPFINCISLQQRLRQDGCLSTRETIRIGIGISSGLSAAHAQGLIHRDVKPANILMEQGVERVVLTDFGLAQATDDVRLTQTDTLVGTPQYMSPEQAEDRVLDCRTDLFSLGSVLYECLAGRPAFQAATSLGMLKKLSESTPTSLAKLNPDVPLWLTQIIDKLLTKDLDHRYRSADEVCRLLKQALSHLEQPTTIGAPSVLPPSSASVRSSLVRSPIFWSLTMFSLTVAAAIGGFTLFPYLDSRDTTPVPEILGGQESFTHEDLPNLFDSETVLTQTTKEPGPEDGKYTSAKQAYSIGVGYYNAREYDLARKPLEAAIRMSDDVEMKVRVYSALMQSYRRIPEFEPMQTAVEYIINHSDQSSMRSLTRRSFLAFSYQRGQFDNLIKRYEKMLKKQPDAYLPVFLLAEIYRTGERDPQRAIELLSKLADLDAERRKGSASEPDEHESAKILIEKGKLARQLFVAKQYVKSAELYIEIAPKNKATEGYHLKEASSAYLKAGLRDKALETAMAANKAQPDQRNDQLTHFFHRNLGDIFMELGKPEKAIPHFEIAVTKTKIEGYVTGTKTSLEKARKAAKKK